MVGAQALDLGSRCRNTVLGLPLCRFQISRNLGRLVNDPLRFQRTLG
jgi:hypothetical protein